MTRRIVQFEVAGGGGGGSSSSSRGGSTIGIVVSSSGFDLFLETPATESNGNAGESGVRDDSSAMSQSQAQKLGYAGAGVAGVLSLFFIILVTRLWTIHSITRRDHHGSSGKYHRTPSNYSPRASKDASDPAIIEATIAHINQTESYVPTSARPERAQELDEPLKVVSVCPSASHTTSPTVVQTSSNGTHPQLKTSSSIVSNGRPKVIRIHSEFEEMESDEEAPPVPKKKSGASKLKIEKAKKEAK
ncbi:uncharacterized protein LOC135811466 isoform X2 [Sycon ciliatum]|uniref:uncharacterized protein LOC135811466 isoform X2 n=1 Tax=Sycon ciliatum TaxID=27933 RepID=UPI0031F6074D